MPVSTPCSGASGVVSVLVVKRVAAVLECEVGEGAADVDGEANGDHLRGSCKRFPAVRDRRAALRRPRLRACGSDAQTGRRTFTRLAPSAKLDVQHSGGPASHRRQIEALQHVQSACSAL